MNLKETLRYMESQLLNEGVVGDYNSFKKKGLDDDTIYKLLSKKYVATEEQIKQEIQTKQQQQKEFNQNQKTINDAKDTDRDNSSEVIDNLNLKNAMKQNTIKELNTQSGKLFQYYQTISSGEELKQKIDSFDKLLFVNNDYKFLSKFNDEVFGNETNKNSQSIVHTFNDCDFEQINGFLYQTSYAKITISESSNRIDLGFTIGINKCIHYKIN